MCVAALTLAARAGACLTQCWKPASRGSLAPRASEDYCCIGHLRTCRRSCWVLTGMPRLCLHCRHRHGGQTRVLAPAIYLDVFFKTDMPNVNILYWSFNLDDASSREVRIRAFIRSAATCTKTPSPYSKPLLQATHSLPTPTPHFSQSRPLTALQDALAAQAAGGARGSIGL